MNNPTPTPPLTLDQKRALLTEALRNRARAQISVAPLSYGQRALWFLYRSDPESAAYHVSFSARIRSHLDVAALKRAFQTLMDRHPCLRSHVRDQNGEPVQQIHGHLDVHFEIADCRALDESALRHAVDSAYRRPFELQRESPLRVNLFDCGANDAVLLITVHHIAYDAWSLWLNLDEIQHLYAAESGGARSALPLLELAYRDHIESQERMLASPQGEQLWAFWKRQLAGAQPTLNVPTDRPRPPVQSYRGTSFRTSLPSSLSRELKKLAQTKRVTPFMLLLAAYQVLLYRYSGQDDILVGSPTTGRGNAQFNNVVGYFVNPVVLRANLAGNPTFEDFLQQVFQTSLNAFQHQDYPFPLLVERLQPQRDPSYAPLFQVSFVYQKPQRAGNAIDWLGWMDASGRRVNWGGLEIEYFDLPQQEGQFDLELEVMEWDASLRCLFKYNVDLFDAATIERFASHFETLLTAIAADPKQHIDSLPLLSEAERHTILWDWNATKVDYPQRGWVHQVFEQQVQATPAAVALTFGDEHLSYAELNKRVNRLAHCLRTAGIGRGSVVGVCLHRSIDMVVALHAVVKAGAAYLPLDPDYPSDRVQYMAKDAAIALLLSHSELLDRFEFDRVPTIALDDECLRITRFPATNPDVSISGDDIAYVIYTSGSTGKPKGVAVPHRGLLNRLQWMQAQHSLDRTDSALQKTPYSFDVSVWEFFWPFMTGARLVVAGPGDHRDTRRLVELIRTHYITTLHFVPSMLRTFLEDTQAGQCTSLRRVFCSGEALPFDLQQQFFATSSASLINLYGPTEASIDVSHWTCPRDSVDTVVPIGHPIANTSLHVLDAMLNPVPIGVAGELHIGGIGLARGYLNQPELTASKFIADPFGVAPGGRLYKTGDLARYRPDGAIEYLGRLDHQVKLRGFRIELGEIESVLCTHSAVQAAIVDVRTLQGDKRLVAYLAIHQGANPPESTQLREFLAQRLPDYMVPAAFVLLDEMPLNANGKVDRKALPAPQTALERAAQFVPPRDELERALARHFEAVLKISPVGMRDNFFELGGHSLLALSLITRLENEFAIRLPIATLFRRPTVEQLADALREQTALTGTSPLVAIQPNGADRPFFCAAGGGGSVLYYYPLAIAMGAQRPFYGLQAPGLDGECAPFTRVEDLAAAYVAEIRKVQAHGPYLLGGHCFGGLVAFEMAQQLRRAGEDIELLALIDVPARRPPVDDSLREADDSTWLIKLAGVINESSGTDLSIDAERLRRLNPQAQLTYFKERMQAVGFLPPGADESKVRGLLRVFAANNTAQYEPTDVLQVPIAVFRAGEFHSDYDFSFADEPQRGFAESTMGWHAYATQRPTVQVVPGNHITMMVPPHVGALAVQLQSALTAAGARTPVPDADEDAMPQIDAIAQPTLATPVAI